MQWEYIDAIRVVKGRSMQIAQVSSHMNSIWRPCDMCKSAWKPIKGAAKSRNIQFTSYIWKTKQQNGNATLQGVLELSIHPICSFKVVPEAALYQGTTCSCLAAGWLHPAKLCSSHITYHPRPQSVNILNICKSLTNLYNVIKFILAGHDNASCQLRICTLKHLWGFGTCMVLGVRCLPRLGSDPFLHTPEHVLLSTLPHPVAITSSPFTLQPT